MLSRDEASTVGLDRAGRRCCRPHREVETRDLAWPRWFLAGITAAAVKAVVAVCDNDGAKNVVVVVVVEIAIVVVMMVVLRC